MDAGVSKAPVSTAQSDAANVSVALNPSTTSDVISRFDLDWSGVDRSTVAAITTFGERYQTDEQLWTQFLVYLQRKLETLASGRVQASVTSRLKTWESLCKKLHARTTGKKKQTYATPEEIERDGELDMLGLRIRAFFPKQLQDTKTLVLEGFELVRERPFRSDYKYVDNISNFEEEFGPYHGMHYWLKIKPDQSEDLDTGLRNRFSEQIFEIQVRQSMLFDGWAEVRHDIIYKTLGGKPSDAERALLDCLKGVVSPMESLLNHLFDVHCDRVLSDDAIIDTTTLLEQALRRSIPKIADQTIDNPPLLHSFLERCSIDNLGQFKQRIRASSDLSLSLDKHLVARKTTQQPIEAFLIDQIFTTLTQEELERLIGSIGELELHFVFCRAISGFEKHLLQQTEPLERIQLSLDERERYTIIWYLHEYIWASGPRYQCNIRSLLRDLLLVIQKRRWPIVDMIIHFAIAEAVHGKAYKLPESHVLQVTQDPSVTEDIAMRPGELDTLNERVLRWHRHDSFYERADLLESLGFDKCCAPSAALLGVDSVKLRGAVLHRAVFHQDKWRNMELVTHLLQKPADVDVNFVNIENQSTIHVAAIFAPTSKTMESLLMAPGINMNIQDSCSETALYAACALERDQIVHLLVKDARTDVNLGRSPSHETAAKGLWDAGRKSKEICDGGFRGDHSYCNIAGCFCTISTTDGNIMSAGHWYARRNDWRGLERIARHPTFDIWGSFGTLRDFFSAMSDQPTKYACILSQRERIDSKCLDNRDKDGMSKKYGNVASRMVELLGNGGKEYTDSM